METTAIVVNEKERNDARGPKSEETRSWKEGINWGPRGVPTVFPPSRRQLMQDAQYYMLTRRGEGGGGYRIRGTTHFSASSSSEPFPGWGEGWGPRSEAVRVP